MPRRKKKNVKYKVSVYDGSEWFSGDRLYDTYEEAEDAANEWMNDIAGDYSTGVDIMNDYYDMHGDDDEIVEDYDIFSDLDYDIEEVEVED